MVEYAKEHVRSLDGTSIGYRKYGRGPGVILVHGGMKAAQHFSKLAEILSREYCVYVSDRRGRGMSGPYRDGYLVQREVEDMQALAAETDARRIFGLSSGALVSLRTALLTPELQRVALYEPPLSVNGSVPTAWLERFDREVAAGRRGTALITAMKAIGTEPLFARVPCFVLAHHGDRTPHSGRWLR